MDNNLTGVHPRLHKEDEATVIENAIRTAITTVMDVIRSADSCRVGEYRRMVADRDEEIRRLECKLEKREGELKMLRLQRGGRPSEDAPRHRVAGASGTGREIRCGKAANTETTRDAKLSCVGGRTPPHISSECHNTSSPVSPSRRASTDSRSSEAAGLSGGTGGDHQPSARVTAAVKEEPSDIETVIKWEVCEGSLLDHQEGRHEGEKRGSKGTEAQRSRRYRERIRADPERLRVYREKDRLRKLQMRICISDLPKETQRQRREAWRAATRRCRARKKALVQCDRTDATLLPNPTIKTNSEVNTREDGHGHSGGGGWLYG